MYHHLRRTFGVTLCLLGLASPLVCAAAPPSTPSPAAQLVAVQGASHPYRLMDYDHRVVTAAVPAQALTDVVSGRVDVMVDAATSAFPRIQSGQLRVLALSSGGRYPLMPDAPAIAETVPGIEFMSWLGLAMPPATPQPIVDRVNKEIRDALNSPLDAGRT